MVAKTTKQEDEIKSNRRSLMKLIRQSRISKLECRSKN